MNTPNFTSLLTALRAFVLKSRPAYRDYLGTESVEEKTVLLTGTLSATGESVTVADGFIGFTSGQTYKATIGEETVEVTAQYGTGSFSECIVIGSSNVAPSDAIPGWMVCVYNGNLLGFGTGDWAGKQIEVATSKMVPVEKWDVKKLPEECLPEKMPENWAEELDTGGGVLYVPMEINYANSQGTGTVNGVTFAEAQQAVKDGKRLVAAFWVEGVGELFVPAVSANSDIVVFEFVSPIFKPSDILIQWTADGQVHYQISNSLDYTVIPVTVTKTDGEYTATSRYTYEQVRALVDEGKNVVVQINNGKELLYASLTYDPGIGLGFTSASIEGFYVMLRWAENGIKYFDNMLLTQFNLSDTTPLPAGTASAGTSSQIARADHVHPAELPKDATANQQLVTNSDGNVVWENRPGGYKTDAIVSTNTHTFTFTETETSGRYKSDLDTGFLGNYTGDFAPDTVYDVTFNGVKYSKIRTDKNQSGCNYLGDPELSAYPFYLGGEKEFQGSGIYFSHHYANVGGEISIKIEKYGEQIIPLPKSYTEAPSYIETDLSNGYWSTSIWDEKENRYLSLHRSNDNSQLRVEADYFYIDSEMQVINQGAPIRFQSENSNQYGLELGNGYIVLASSTANSTKKFKITVDDTGTLSATEITTT